MNITKEKRQIIVEEIKKGTSLKTIALTLFPKSVEVKGLTKIKKMIAHNLEKKFVKHYRSGKPF